MFWTNYLLNIFSNSGTRAKLRTRHLWLLHFNLSNQEPSGKGEYKQQFFLDFLSFFYLFCWIDETIGIQSTSPQSCQAVRLQPEEREERERRFSDALDPPSTEADQQWHCGSRVNLNQLVPDFGQNMLYDVHYMYWASAQSFSTFELLSKIRHFCFLVSNVGSKSSTQWAVFQIELLLIISNPK